MTRKSWDRDPYNWDMTTPDGSACVSDEELAAYVDGGLREVDRARVEVHAAECDECRGVITAAMDTLATYGERRRRMQYAGGGLVAAAALVLLFVATPPNDPHAAGSVERGSSSAPLSEDVPRFAALAPETGAVVLREDLLFAWEAVGAGSLYQLTISDERGGVVWSERTELTSLTLPASVAASLSAGHVYYWRVEALLPDLRSAASRVRSFTVREP